MRRESWRGMCKQTTDLNSLGGRFLVWSARKVGKQLKNDEGFAPGDCGRRARTPKDSRGLREVITSRAEGEWLQG